jgi:hypothetical protein
MEENPPRLRDRACDRQWHGHRASHLGHFSEPRVANGGAKIDLALARVIAKVYNGVTNVRQEFRKLMARKKAGRPPGGTKGSVLSVRVTPEMRTRLEIAARKNKRRLSREVEARLDYTLGRYQKLKVEGRPPHIMALSDTVAVAARLMEETTGRPWNSDQYTSQHLARLICAVMADFTQPGEVTIPPKVIEEAKRHPAGDAYPTHLGEDKAKGVIALIRLTDSQWWGPNCPDVVLEVEKIQRDLRPKRRK